MRRPDTAGQLLAVAGEDRTVRARLAATGELTNSYHPRMRAVYRRNVDGLAQITAELAGWPGLAAVGRDGSGAAFAQARCERTKRPRPQMYEERAAGLSIATMKP